MKMLSNFGPLASRTFKILLFLLSAAVICGNGQDFGYDGHEGPTHWGEKYAKCFGKYQSPIDIELPNVKQVHFPRMKFDHFNKRLEGVELKNDGHTVKIYITKGKLPTIAGGPLKGTYQFHNLHFHWGHNDSEGSENMINHHSFPLELHMVFFKTDYGNLEASLDHHDGLTVLAFLFEATDEENKYYTLFQDGLYRIQDVNATLNMTNFVSLDKFTSKKRDSYLTYEGSLTTPPCSEVVTWIEFQNTIPLAHSQIQQFRDLSDSHGVKLTHNYRPIQPVHGRVIKMNKHNSATLNRSSVVQTLLLISIFISLQSQFL